MIFLKDNALVERDIARHCAVGQIHRAVVSRYACPNTGRMIVVKCALGHRGRAVSEETTPGTIK